MDVDSKGDGDGLAGPGPRGIDVAAALDEQLLDLFSGAARQNLFFAFVYTVGVPIAAGVAYPAFGLLLSPMLASAAMAVNSVSVIANALRLRRIPLQLNVSLTSLVEARAEHST